uniref:taste receptor type 2 member 140-like n=1 Tax=Jaculus jaculus TaxID=51337 RepID=UPI001E1B0B7C|nr:taste receptor type 2 member 140-like [Jaculus jaculus]
MDHTTYGMLMKVYSTEFIIGSLGNGFIVLMNCMDWAKRRKLSTVDQILTLIAIFRIALLWLVLIGIALSLHYPGLFMSNIIIRMICISWVVANHFSNWLATCLSIFYFLKVANFCSSTFHSLTCRVRKVVLMTLLVSLLLLSLNVVMTNAYVDFSADGSTSNKSYSSSWNNASQVTKVLLFTCSAFTALPFTVSLTTCVLLIVSLRKHMKKMQHNLGAGRDGSTSAHITALRTMMSFLPLYAIFLLLLIIQISKFKTLEERTIIIYDQIIGTAFSIGHSCVLILADSKLRPAALTGLWCVRGKVS